MLALALLPFALAVIRLYPQIDALLVVTYGFQQDGAQPTRKHLQHLPDDPSPLVSVSELLSMAADLVSHP